jgi:hypothetical protein
MRPRSTRFLGLVLGAALAGCGQSLPPAADADQARAALRVALDAWQQGGKAQTLLERSPPIRVVDDDWDKGWSLKSYKIAKDKQLGQQRRVSAHLSLRGTDGKTMDKNVNYDIDTAPAIVIVRTFE